MAARHRARPSFFVAIAVGIAVRIAFRATVLDSFVDDAFIFWRYAKNAATGHGLVYNTGEHVMGFTSPLFTLMLSAVAVVVRPVHLETAAVVLAFLLFALASWSVLALTRDHHRFPWWYTILWLAYGPFLDASLTGMETMLYVFVIFGVVGLLASGRTSSATALAVASVLVRPEGAIVAVAALVTMTRVRDVGRAARRGAAAGGALVLAWVVFASAYFGSPIAQPLLAKSSAIGAGVARTSLNPLELLGVLSFGISSEKYLDLVTPIRMVVLAGGLVVAATVIHECIDMWERRSALLPLPALYLGTWALYSIGEPVRIWTWYATPTAVIGLWCFFRVVGRIVARRELRTTGTFGRGLVGAVIVVAVAASLIVAVPGRRTSSENSVAILDRVATLVSARVPAARSVMLGDIGVVGFRTDLEVIDLSGLVSERTLRDEPDGQLPSIGALVMRDCPDVVVLQNNPFASPTAIEGSINRNTLSTDAERSFLRAEYEDISTPDLGRMVFARRAVLAGNATPCPPAPGSP